MGDSTIVAGMEELGSRGPLGLVGCGIGGGDTDVCIGWGTIVDVVEEYTDTDGAGDPVPYCGYDESRAGTTF